MFRAGPFPTRLRVEEGPAALSINVPNGGKRSHHGPSRLEAAMEKYNKMTLEAQKKAKNKPSASPTRSGPRGSIKQKKPLKVVVVETAVRTWRVAVADSYV